jgi:hypothetical protein
VGSEGVCLELPARAGLEKLDTLMMKTKMMRGFGSGMDVQEEQEGEGEQEEGASRQEVWGVRRMPAADAVRKSRGRASRRISGGGATGQRGDQRGGRGVTRTRDTGKLGTRASGGHTQLERRRVRVGVQRG